MQILMFSLMCAILPAALVVGAMALSPSAIAQQEETSLGEEEEELADDVLSDVLDWGSSDNDDNEDENDDGGGAAGDDSNTQTAIPLIDQDQGAANLALNEALDVTVESTPPPPKTQEPECSLEITADNEIYEPGDVVAITITNTGDVPLEFPDSILGLEIKNVDTGEVLLLDALQVETALEPGESMTFRFEYEDLVREIGTGLISATVTSDCGTEEDTFRLLAEPPD